MNYRKYEAANPYVIKLSVLDDEIALNVSPSCTSSDTQLPIISWGNLLPRPRPDFRHFQYGKAGEGLVSFLMRVTSHDDIWKGLIVLRTAQRAKVSANFPHVSS